METEFSKYEPLFGSWKINKLIGEGNYGRVYEIEREDFGVTYRAALKAITIPKNQSDIKSVMSEGMDEESASTYFRSFVEEFTNEFAIMDKLKGCSNIVNYEDHIVYKHENGIGWDILIKMELLTSLNDYLAEHRVDENLVIRLGTDLCRALEVCDDYNVIHRDIKPENVFVNDRGVFKLGDFGIARVAEKTTGASTKVGTNSYMAPEVVRGDRYTSKVDTYSLGIMLYKLLNNNRLPFLPPAPAPITYSIREEANAKRLKGEDFPLPALADRKLADVILKATAFNPDDRFDSPRQMREALEECIGIVPRQFIVQEQPQTTVEEDNYEEKTIAVPGLGQNANPVQPVEKAEDTVKKPETAEIKKNKPDKKDRIRVIKITSIAVIATAIAMIVLFAKAFIFTTMDGKSTISLSLYDMMSMRQAKISFMGNGERMFNDCGVQALLLDGDESVPNDKIYWFHYNDSLSVYPSNIYPEDVFTITGHVMGEHILLVTDGQRFAHITLDIMDKNGEPSDIMDDLYNKGYASLQRVDVSGKYTYKAITLDLLGYYTSTKQTDALEQFSKNGTFYTTSSSTIPCPYNIGITSDNKLQIDIYSTGVNCSGFVDVFVVNKNDTKVYSCIRIPVTISS